MARPKSEKKMVTVSARVETEKQAALVDLAKAMSGDRPFTPTVSQLVGAAIDEYIAKYAKKYRKHK
jgi:hypothetical protein